jgi:SAM-dependent methyltransferase
MAALRSLNQAWGRHSFHERLGELAGIRPGDAVLDLGCGAGWSLDTLLKRAGALGRVVALDRDPRALDAIREDRADAIKSGRLAVVNADIADEMPLPDGTFDVVICQNVVECVQDKDGLIEAACRALRGGGRLLIGHHDFDSAVLASTDRELTRRRRSDGSPASQSHRAIPVPFSDHGDGAFRRPPSWRKNLRSRLSESGPHRRPAVGDRPCDLRRVGAGPHEIVPCRRVLLQHPVDLRHRGEIGKVEPVPANDQRDPYPLFRTAGNGRPFVIVPAKAGSHGALGEAVGEERRRCSALMLVLISRADGRMPCRCHDGSRLSPGESRDDGKGLGTRSRGDRGEEFPLPPLAQLLLPPPKASKTAPS